MSLVVVDIISLVIWSFLEIVSNTGVKLLFFHVESDVKSTFMDPSYIVLLPCTPRASAS